jgi:hypothetical protein
MYYPLIQVISRFFVSWYSIEYGNNKNPANNTDTYKFTIQVLGAVFPNLGSILYLIVFLKMQPKAYSHLMTRLRICRRQERRDDGDAKLPGIHNHDFKFRDTYNAQTNSGDPNSNSTGSDPHVFQWIRQSHLHDVGDDDLYSFYETNKLRSSTLTEISDRFSRSSHVTRASEADSSARISSVGDDQPHLEFSCVNPISSMDASVAEDISSSFAVDSTKRTNPLEQSLYAI